MSTEFLHDDKGKVKPPQHEEATPEKESAPLTTADLQGDISAQTVTKMQQTLGNGSVQRFLAQRKGQGPSEVDDEIAGSIDSKRGSGSELDEGIASKAGAVMGQDFSDVKVHTDADSDHLNQELGAKAFTTGKDIFFRDGAYDPSSSAGQHLISHELTHVVQQGGSVPSVQGKMTVNDPNDQFESEADTVADTVMSQPENLQRQEEEEELQMQEEEEEELQMQEEEEEELQMQEEEEELLQAQELEEEELMQG